MDPDPAFLINPNRDTGNEVHSASISLFFKSVMKCVTPGCSNSGSAENEFADVVKLLHFLLGALSRVLPVPV